jgi:sugar phosphate isomerase/epimerase
MALPPVGLQFIVFGKKYNLNEHADVMLDAVAKAGYAGVECGAPKDMKGFLKKLEARKLKLGGTHVGLRNLENPAPLIEFLHAGGSKDLCNSGLLDWNKRTPADYQEGIKRLNAAGKLLRKEGIRLHYHNHDFELAKVDGEKTGMDLLMAGLDPEACDLCVDVAWVKRGGADPAEFLKKNGRFVGFLHLKDFNDEGWIELGQGKVDFPAILKVLPSLTKVSWAMIEQDSTKLDPLESIAISRANLKNKFGY